MDLTRAVFRRMARVAKRESDLELDEALTGRAIRTIVWRTAENLLRGKGWYGWQFASTDGPLFVGRHVTILNPELIHVGRNFKAEDFAEIQGMSRRGIRFGDRVTIGRNVSIRPSSYYGNQLGEGLEVGDGSSIGPNSFVGAAGFVRIGSDVMIGPRVSILPENHNFEDVGRAMKSQGTNRQGIVIEDDCWLGANSCILDGVTLGRGTIVATGAVVTKSMPPYSIVAGVPARVVRSRQPPTSSERSTA